jgi:hypothetical protein
MQAIGETVVFLLFDCAITKIFSVSYDMDASIYVFTCYAFYHDIEARIFLVQASDNNFVI